MRELKTRVEKLEKDRTELIVRLGELTYAKMRNLSVDNNEMTEIGEKIVELDKDLFKDRKEIQEILASREKLQCPNCSAPITKEDKFCKECGEAVVKEDDSLVEVGNCEICGNVLYEGENFCSCCGTKA